MNYTDAYRLLAEQRAYDRDIEARGLEAIIEPYVVPFVPAQRRSADAEVPVR